MIITKAPIKSDESSDRILQEKNIKQLVDEGLNKINKNIKINKRNKRQGRFSKLIILIFLIKFICIIASFIFLKYFPFNFSVLEYLNIYVVADKDFYNNLTNPYYKILCDNKTSQLKNQYQLKIIETYENNELFLKKRGYSEGSKIYYIWKKYKKREISSKYVGFNHYRRVFLFKNNIPDLDKIFNQSDSIINKKIKFSVNVKNQFSKCLSRKYIDEIEEIIKENFTEYYSQAIKSLNQNYFSCCNIFIMKQEDFIKYGEFVFGVLLEFDRRHKLNNDNDIKNLVSLEFKREGIKSILYRSRLEAFLMERISIIFYDYYFKKSHEIRVTHQ